MRSCKQYTIDDGILYQQGKRVVIPSDYEDILNDKHDNAGHPGIAKLRKIVSQMM